MEPVTGNDLLNLILQKPPFVMLSKLLSAVPTKCLTSFIINADNVLCDNGVLSASGLIENIAQSCAAMNGYESLIQNKKTPVGFIGEVRDFSYQRLPKAGEEIVTEINVENSIFGVTLLSGKISLKGEEIASCKMKVFIKSDEN